MHDNDSIPGVTMTAIWCYSDGNLVIQCTIWCYNDGNLVLNDGNLKLQ